MYKGKPFFFLLIFVAKPGLWVLVMLELPQLGSSITHSPCFEQILLKIAIFFSNEIFNFYS